jgi:sugar phosphate isomerase/epimerase
MPQHFLCVSHLTAIDAPAEAFIDGAAAAGFDAVGLRVIPPRHAPTPVIAGDRPRIAALRRRAADQGIGIFEAESFGLDADTRVRDYLPALEAAAELGARHIVSGGIDPDEARLATHYAELAELAQGFGLGMAIEFMPIRPMKSLADALRVIGQVGHPNARILIDALHLARSGGTPQDVARVDPARIAYLQLCDAPQPALQALTEESRQGRLHPGEGGLPIAQLIEALPADLPISLEAPHAHLGHLPPHERLRLAGLASRRFLSGVRARGVGSPLSIPSQESQ